MQLEVESLQVPLWSTEDEPALLECGDLSDLSPLWLRASERKRRQVAALISNPNGSGRFRQIRGIRGH